MNQQNNITLILLLFVSFFVSAEVVHEGFLGGPFHGTVQDAQMEVHVQLGPTADLIIPNGLVAHAEQSHMASGGTSNLHASLLLDDGTHTVLDPAVVEWTFSEPGLNVQDGSLLAEIMSERTMIRVQATAEGFSASFNIFILADDGEVAQAEIENLPESLRSAIELEATGWKESEWFGVFYDAQNGWLYHADYGWIYVADDGPNTNWFWSDQLQWVWTGKNIYPHLYRNRDAAWLYFFKQALPEKVFYNYQTRRLERFADR